MKKVFIYKIENVENGKMYIGSSVTPQKRWYQHKKQLRNGVHHSLYLQNSWNKYGEECFVFEVIDECLLENQFSLEKEWVTKEKTFDSEYGYNMAIPTEGGGYSKTEERKKVIGEASKKHMLAYHQKQKDSGKRKVKVYDLITGEYEIFPSTKDCPYSFKKNGHYNFRIGKLKLKADMDDNSIKLIVKEYTLKYQHFLRTQSSETNYQLPKKEIYSHQYSTIWKSDNEILEFTTNVKAAEYFNISLPYVCLIVKKGIYKEFVVEKFMAGGAF